MKMPVKASIDPFIMYLCNHYRKSEFDWPHISVVSLNMLQERAMLKAQLKKTKNQYLMMVECKQLRAKCVILRHRKKCFQNSGNKTSFFFFLPVRKKAS